MPVSNAFVLLDSACRFQYPLNVGPVAIGRSATPLAHLTAVQQRGQERELVRTLVTL